MNEKTRRKALRNANGRTTLMKQRDVPGMSGMEVNMISDVLRVRFSKEADASLGDYP